MGSKAERAFFHGGVACDVRADGRRRFDFRALTLTLGALPHLAGSAQLRLGGTEVLVGVRAEIDSPAAERPGEGRLEVCVELLDVGGDRRARGAAEELEASLAASLQSSLRARLSLDWAALCVLPGQRCWLLGLDCLVLADDGALLDALSLCAKAALHDVTLPVLEAAPPPPSGEPASADFELGSALQRLDCSRVPLCLTVHRAGPHCLLDCDGAEARAADAALWLAVRPCGALCGGGVCTGSGALAPQAVAQMTGVGREAGAALQRALAAFLKTASSQSLLPENFSVL